MKFSDLDLHPDVKKGIDAQGFTECTPIQVASIPGILEGKDIAGLAQTGTGKTAAYLLPLMDRMLRSQTPKESSGEDASADNAKERPIFADWKDTNYVLILVPTRELATQVVDNVKELDASGKFRSIAVFGGTSYDPQKKALQEGVEFVVATPGRLIDLYKEHVVDLGQVRAVVFDEADRMFDMGFKDDMKYILKRIPRDRQFLVFSATLNFDVMNVAYEFGAEPVEVNVSRDQAKAENVVDEIFHVGHQEKPGHLLSLLKKHEPRQAIIFSNYKSNVDRIATFLSNNGVPAMGISSLLSQGQRNRVMEQFKADNNDRNILVATDVAARGLDVEGVDLVINYELPDDAENYVHRIGRTGRAGAEGHAFSLVSDRDVDALARIEDYLKNKVKMGWLDDQDIITEFKEFPRDESRRGTPAGRRPSRNSDRRPRDGDSKGGRGSSRGRSKEGERSNRKRSSERSGERSNERSEQRTDNKKAEGQSSDRNAKSRSRSRSNEDKRQKSSESGRSAEGNTHRDRLTGRHKQSGSSSEQQKNRSSEKSAAGASSNSANPKKAKTNRRRPQNNKGQKLVRKGGSKGSQYKGGRYRVNQESKSLGQKVSGFIKNLFGGESKSN